MTEQQIRRKAENNTRKRHADENEPKWRTKKKAKPEGAKVPRARGRPGKKPKAGPCAERSLLGKQQTKTAVGSKGFRKPRNVLDSSAAEGLQSQAMCTPKSKILAGTETLGSSDQKSILASENQISAPAWLRDEIVRIEEEFTVIASGGLAPGSPAAIGQRIVFPLLEDLHVNFKGKVYSVCQGLHVGR